MEELQQTEIKEVNGKLATTSLDVANKFGKHHKNILRDIEKLQCSEEFWQTNFEPSDYIDTRGKKQPMAVISKDGFMLLVMGYNGSKAMEIKEWYIDMFNRMDNHIKKTSMQQLPSNYLEALESLVTTVKEKEKLSEDNAIMKPKADHYDRLMSSQDAISIGEVAKALNYDGIGRNTLFNILKERDILMNNNLPYQRYMKYFKVTENPYIKPDGSRHSSLKTLVNQKGVEFIRKELEKHLDQDTFEDAKLTPQEQYHFQSV